MNHEEFVMKVERLERDAKAKPEAYKLKVFLWALLGYAYPGLIIIILLALAGLLIYLVATVGMSGSSGTILFKLVFPLMFFIYLILRSFWIKIPHPSGIQLDHEQAGLLFESVSQFREKLKGPRVHSILLTGELNASVIQIPRLGLLGWQKNYLIVGLPLLQALSPQEFYGVLAHEFGHLAGAHSRFGAWIYRMREAWNRLVESLEQQEHWGTFIFSRFLRAYVPFFNAYAFVLARQQEYEADRNAAILAGSRNMADALIRISLSRYFLELVFWPSVYQTANKQADPPASPFRETQEALANPIAVEDTRQWLDRSMKEKTGYSDTHPSLSDRLAALGEEPRLPPLPAETAADHYLGEHVSQLTDTLNQSWRESIIFAWRDRHQQAQDAGHRLSEIEKKSETEPLTIEERWEMASLTEEFRDSAAALPIYQEVLAADAQHAAANFAVGRLILEKMEASGVGLIEKAMRLDQQYVIPGCELIYQYLTEQGNEQEAKKYFVQALHQAENYQAAQKERARIGFDDSYLPPALNPEILNSIRDQIALHQEIDKAYLVRKAVKLMPEIPLYILGITVNTSWYKYRSDSATSDLCQQIAQEIVFSGDIYVVFVDGENKKLRKIMERIEGALIYQNSHFIDRTQ
jgi:Zn-dependent protease with chaperone function